MKIIPTVPLFVTVPHSGEEAPPEAVWLASVGSDVMLLDIDRFVNQLYEPTILDLQIPWVVAGVHRYAVDLNRFPGDVDLDSVEGASEASGKHTTGFHWVKSTKGHILMSRPITEALHDELVRKYHDTFHAEISQVMTALKSRFVGLPLYHLDCHSMPSQGTDAHKDAGRERAEVVISDVHGVSASPLFKDLVLGAFRAEKFEVAYNWPYTGGRITQRYGQPAKAHHTVQIELNRKIYMDEGSTREKQPAFPLVQMRLKAAMTRIVEGIEGMHAPGAARA